MRLYEMWPKQATWRKSSFCAAGECLEIAQKDDTVLLRNNRSPRVVVRVSTEEWEAFAKGFVSGEFADIG
jgi:hypothetical protein